MAKKIFALMLCLSMVLAFVACTGNGATTAPVGTTKGSADGVKSNEKFTITYFDFVTTGPLVERLNNSVKEKWYKMYPNSTLEITNPPTDGLEILQTQLASGTAADVFKHQTRLAAFAKAGYMMDLSDQPWCDDVVAGCMPDCFYDGKFYAAPADCNGWGVYYVKQIYEDKLKLTVPKNFQEFVDNCQAIKDAGYNPLITGGADGWPFQGLFLTFTSFLYGADPDFHKNLYNGTAKWTDESVHELFDAIELLYDKGFFSDATMSIDIATSRQYMGEGKAVIGFGCPGVLTPLEEPDSGFDIDLGYFYIPDWDGYNCVPVIADVVWSINAKYEFGSTYGIDLLNCLIDPDTLHKAYDNVSPVGYKSISMNYNTLGGQMYQDAFDKGPVVLQCTSWLPSSIFDLYQQIVSSILSGNGYTDEMLENMQKTYEADRSNVNILLD